MRPVGVDGPPASKVRAIRGLLVFPLSISAEDTGCTPGGVSQADGTVVGIGVGIKVGVGVGVTVGVGLVVVVGVGMGVGVPP